MQVWVEQSTVVVNSPVAAGHGGVFLEVDRGDCWACDRHWNLGKLNVNSIWAMWGGRGGVTANRARRR